MLWCRNGFGRDHTTPSTRMATCVMGTLSSSVLSIALRQRGHHELEIDFLERLGLAVLVLHKAHAPARSPALRHDAGHVADPALGRRHSVADDHVSLLPAGDGRRVSSSTGDPLWHLQFTS